MAFARQGGPFCSNFGGAVAQKLNFTYNRHVHSESLLVGRVDVRRLVVCLYSLVCALAARSTDHLVGLLQVLGEAEAKHGAFKL